MLAIIVCFTTKFLISNRSTTYFYDLCVEHTSTYLFVWFAAHIVLLNLNKIPANLPSSQNILAIAATQAGKASRPAKSERREAEIFFLLGTLLKWSFYGNGFMAERDDERLPEDWHIKP